MFTAPKEKRLVELSLSLKGEEASSIHLLQKKHHLLYKEFDLLLYLFIITISTHLGVLSKVCITLTDCKGSFGDPRKPKVFGGEHENY